MEKVRKLVQTALLIAFAIIIPLYFGFLKVVIGGFTATIASHVPMFLSMFLGPASAAMVGIGSVIGFQISGMPTFVVARAAMHIIVGVFGSYLLRKDVSYTKMVLITAPIHGILEGLAIIPFMGFTPNNYVVAIGTIIHHSVDATIAFGLVKSLVKAGRKEFALNR